MSVNDCNFVSYRENLQVKTSPACRKDLHCVCMISINWRFATSIFFCASESAEVVLLWGLFMNRLIKKQRYGMLTSSHLLGGVALLVAGMLFVLCGTLQAQVGSASLSGVVQDQSGAVIPGAAVKLANAQNGAERTATSNSSGSFTFAAVSSGDYNLTITANGFSDYVRNGIHLNPGDSQTIAEIKLAVGGGSQSVSVQTTVSGLPLDSGQLSATITAADLEKLSIVGRDATELQRTLPGFAIRSLDSTNSAPDFSQVQIGQATPYASNGAPVAGITLKLDGASLTDAGSFGANLQNINDSFVSEVQVQTSNFGADQSNGPVVITGVTKAGTSSYHGSLYTYARTNQLNANDWLAKHNGFARPNDRYVYPGGTISGPVPGLKKLTFFAGAEYDAQRNVYAYNNVSSAVVHALVPTQAMRQGDFSTAALQQYLGPNYTSGTYADISPAPTVGDNGSPLTNGNIGAFLDPGAMALINRTLPLPTEATGADGFNWVNENLVNNNIFQSAGRLDYAIGPRNTIFGRYSYEQGKQGQPQIPYYSPSVSSILGAVNTPGYGVLNDIHVHSAAANYVTIFNPTLTNELYATLTYFNQAFEARQLSTVQSSAISYPYNGIFDNGSTQYPQLRTYAAVGGLPLGLWPDFSFGAPSLKKFQPSIGDNLTKVWGKHTLKAGIFAQRVTNNQTITNGDSNGAIQNYYFNGAGTPFHSYNGQYPDGSPAFDPTTHYNSGNWLADFFEGHIQTFDQQTILPRTNVYFWDIDFYGQDNWRVTPRLVINYGVRFQHLQAWTDSHGIGAAVWTPSTITSAFDPTKNPLPGLQWHALNSSIPNSGTGTPSLFYSPRVGFAWDIAGTGKTVLRGGVGSYRFHDAETDVDSAFQESRGMREALLAGFGNATLAGISSLHLNPATYGSAGGTESFAAVPSIFGLDTTDQTDPITNNYSLSLAQQFQKNTVMQISYVGNNSNSLMNNGTTQSVVLNNINAIPIGTLYLPSSAATINKNAPGACNPTACTPQQVANLSATVGYPGQPSVQYVRPYPEYGTITVPRHNTYANYNALQVLVQKQTGRLNYMANYTWSRAMGILGSAADFNFTAPVDPFHLRNNYGPMNFDRSQILNLTYSYQSGKIVHDRRIGGFVNDWLISGITTIQSGGNMQTGVSFSPNFYVQGTIGTTNPINVSNQVILGTPDVSLQPTLKCNPGSGLTKNQYLNGACFGLPAFGTNGQYILPYVHGPAFFNSDLTLEKGFSMGGERSLRLRVAAFNFLNHPLNSFGTGYASQTTLVLSDLSPNATTATAAYSPSSGFGFAPLKLGRRLMEVSAKFSF
jgi:hypothetical protein